MFISINKLRKEGKLNEAWHMAQNQLIKNPNDQKIKTDLLWVYYSYCKIQMETNRMDNMLKTLQQIRKIHFFHIEYFNNAMNWLMIKLLIRNKTQSQGTISINNVLITYLKIIKQQTPSESKSVFIHNIIGFIHQYPENAHWIISLGIEDFRKEDFKPTIVGQKPMMALFERWFYVYMKSVINTDSIKSNLELHEKTINILKFSYELHKYRFAEYYYAKYLLIDNKLSEARMFAKSFLIKNLEKSWAWELYAHCLSDKKQQIKLLSKAVLLNCKPEYSLSIRMLLIEIYQDLGLNKNSELTASTIIDIRKRNNWNITPFLKNLCPNKDGEANRGKEFAELMMAESFDCITIVLNDVIQLKAAITGFNKHTSFYYLILENGKTFKTKLSKGIGKSTLLTVYLHNDKPIYFQELAITNIQTEAIKTIEDKIICKTNYGFIGQAYIHPKLYQTLKGKGEVKVLCIREMNTKTNSFGWRAIKVYK